MGLLRKHVAASKLKVGSAGVPAQEEWSAFPALLEFLASEMWDEDQSARVRGTVTLFADECGVKAMLNDKDGGRTAFVLPEVEEGILDALEKALTSTTLKWLAAKKWGSAKGR